MLLLWPSVKGDRRRRIRSGAQPLINYRCTAPKGPRLLSTGASLVISHIFAERRRATIGAGYVRMWVLRAQVEGKLGGSLLRWRFRGRTADLTYRGRRSHQGMYAPTKLAKGPSASLLVPPVRKLDEMWVIARRQPAYPRDWNAYPSPRTHATEPRAPARGHT